MLYGYYTPVFALVIVAVLAAFAAAVGFSGLEFEDDLAQRVGTHLLALVFFALLIERAVEVIVNNRFIEREFEINSEVLRFKREGAILQSALDLEVQQPVPAMTDPAAATAASDAKNDRIEELRRQIRKAKTAKIDADKDAAPSRAKLSAEKTRYAAATATIFGGLIALTGTTILSEFVKEETLTETGLILWIANQQQVLAGVDILLTALILAGGSDGVHQIIKSFLKVKDDLFDMT